MFDHSFDRALITKKVLETSYDSFVPLSCPGCQVQSRRDSKLAFYNPLKPSFNAQGTGEEVEEVWCVRVGNGALKTTAAYVHTPRLACLCSHPVPESSHDRERKRTRTPNRYVHSSRIMYIHCPRPQTPVIL